MLKNIVIFGKNGQVGSELCSQFNSFQEYNVTSYGSKYVDFSKPESLKSFLENIDTNIDIIINAAAYTNVDKAEEDKDVCDAINNISVGVIADYCKNHNITLIHYSTDYVFDGSGDQPFEESNIKNLNPINFYGQTKLDGENAIIKSECNHVILRVSWVHSKDGKNFVNTIKRLAQEREELSIIDDQIGSPTSAEFIAKNTIKIIQKFENSDKSINGIYHLVEDKEMSWYDFALEIISELRKSSDNVLVKKVNKIKTSEYKTAAKRPLNSRLNTNKIQSLING